MSCFFCCIFRSFFLSENNDTIPQSCSNQSTPRSYTHATVAVTKPRVVVLNIFIFQIFRVSVLPWHFGVCKCDCKIRRTKKKQEYSICIVRERFVCNDHRTTTTKIVNNQLQYSKFNCNLSFSHKKKCAIDTIDIFQQERNSTRRKTKSNASKVFAPRVCVCLCLSACVQIDKCIIELRLIARTFVLYWQCQQHQHRTYIHDDVHFQLLLPVRVRFISNLF